VECKKIKAQEYYRESGSALAYFNENRLYLGALCEFEHRFNGGGSSLRRKSDDRCAKCVLTAKVEKDEVRRKQRAKEGKNQKEKERMRKYSEKYYLENKERKKEYIYEWNKKNPGYQFWAKEERRNRVSRQSDGTVTKEFVFDCLFKSSDKCCYCLASIENTTKVVDHIIPIAKGGLHSARNLVVCCSACNRRKGAKTYSEWLDCLEPKQRKSAERLYYKRYGVSPLQGVLPLVFEQEDKSDE
jgi:5-methylcytosine-specific restriction endonuclease McrA